MVMTMLDLVKGRDRHENRDEGRSMISTILPELFAKRKENSKLDKRKDFQLNLSWKEEIFWQDFY